jgi:crotonobetainyl-CoA hydratase
MGKGLGMTELGADGESDREEPIRLERRGSIRIITLNRPRARNAVNLALTLALGQALEDADDDPQTRAVIVTGAGEQAFCAGVDLKAVSRGEPLMPDDPVRAAWGFAGYVSHPISKPTIAAVNGLALGGGTEISLASDLVVAADTAAFGLPEVRLGLYAGAGGVFRLPAQLPKKIAMELILTGEPISAQRALELGLVNRVVPREQVLAAAVELAERICANAPLAVQASKRIANRISDGQVPDEAADWDRSEREGRALMATADAAEGPRAFAQKRAPQWEGR